MYSGLCHSQVLSSVGQYLHWLWASGPERGTEGMKSDARELGAGLPLLCLGQSLAWSQVTHSAFSLVLGIVYSSCFHMCFHVPQAQIVHSLGRVFICVCSMHSQQDGSSWGRLHWCVPLQKASVRNWNTAYLVSRFPGGGRRLSGGGAQ